MPTNIGPHPSARPNEGKFDTGLHSQWPLAGLFLLVVVSHISFFAIEHFTLGDEWLLNPTFDSPPGGWSIRGPIRFRDRHAVLGSEGPDDYALTQAVLAPPGTEVQLAAVYRLDGIVRGPLSWQSARIELVGRDADGQWHWDFDNTLISATGTGDWTDARTVLRLPPRFVSYRVDAHLVNAPGTFSIDLLSLRTAHPRNGVHAVCMTLGAVWLALFALSLRLLPPATAAIALALGALLFLPGIREAGSTIAGWAGATINPGVSEAVSVAIHLSASAAVAWLFVHATRSRPWTARTTADADSRQQIERSASPRRETVEQDPETPDHTRKKASDRTTGPIPIVLWIALPCGALMIESLQHLAPGREVTLADTATNLFAVLTVLSVLTVSAWRKASDGARAG